MVRPKTYQCHAAIVSLSVSITGIVLSFAFELHFAVVFPIGGILIYLGWWGWYMASGTHIRASIYDHLESERRRYGKNISN